MYDSATWGWGDTWVLFKVDVEVDLFVVRTDLPRTCMYVCVIYNETLTFRLYTWTRSTSSLGNGHITDNTPIRDLNELLGHHLKYFFIIVSFLNYKLKNKWNYITLEQGHVKYKNIL